MARGKRLVTAAVFMALLFYGAFLWATLVENRFGIRAGTPDYNLTLFLTIVGFVLAASLAVAAYVTHRAPRAIYLVLNLAGGILGVIWVGVQILRGASLHWLALDLVGVGTAGFVCWVFLYSASGRRFLAEKELTVKRA